MGDEEVDKQRQHILEIMMKNAVEDIKRAEDEAFMSSMYEYFARLINVGDIVVDNVEGNLHECFFADEKSRSFRDLITGRIQNHKLEKVSEIFSKADPDEIVQWRLKNGK